jgi:glucoamylase
MQMRADTPLEVWAQNEFGHCAAKLAQSISATALVKERPGFGTTVRPIRGAVLASPSSGDPDYFFHWLRDSAAIMDAVRILIRRGENVGAWIERFNDFVRFSLGLREINGPDFLKRNAGFRDKADPWFQQYIRPDEEIAAVEGERVLGEARVNADGTLDFICWNRPQHDGPAARALVCLRFWDDAIIEGDAKLRLEELIHGDLDYTARFAGDACYDIWEEERAQHYYTVLVQFAALEQGARWADGEGDSIRAAHLRGKAGSLSELLKAFWYEPGGFIRSRLPQNGIESEKALDFAVILGVLHAGIETGAHSVQAPHVRATLHKLEDLFASEYALNRGRTSGLLYGRYKGDRYVSGGAYFFSTYGAAEYYYRLAAAIPTDAAANIAKGDAILSRTRDFIPASGDLSEQLDQTTGAQTSASDLSWSYACFITAWDARRAACEKAGINAA